MSLYDGAMQGMYISPDENHYSLLPFYSDNKKYLLIGGENHIPGIGDADSRLSKLSDYGNKWFDIGKFRIWKWKAMDYIAYDRIPVVGKLYPWSKRTFVISGFKKWGLVSSMVAANILRDEFAGARFTDRENLLSASERVRRCRFLNMPIIR
jgi:glycine/D-amino acid oxidase-like deaminating enzyme